MRKLRETKRYQEKPRETKRNQRNCGKQWETMRIHEKSGWQLRETRKKPKGNLKKPGETRWNNAKLGDAKIKQEKPWGKLGETMRNQEKPRKTRRNRGKLWETMRIYEKPGWQLRETRKKTKRKPRRNPKKNPGETRWNNAKLGDTKIKQEKPWGKLGETKRYHENPLEKVWETKCN